MVVRPRESIAVKGREVTAPVAHHEVVAGTRRPVADYDFTFSVPHFGRRNSIFYPSLHLVVLRERSTDRFASHRFPTPAPTRTAPTDHAVEQVLTTPAPPTILASRHASTLLLGMQVWSWVPSRPCGQSSTSALPRRPPRSARGVCRRSRDGLRGRASGSTTPTGCVGIQALIPAARMRMQCFHETVHAVIGVTRPVHRHIARLSGMSAPLLDPTSHGRMDLAHRRGVRVGLNEYHSALEGPSSWMKRRTPSPGPTGTGEPGTGEQGRAIQGRAQNGAPLRAQ